LSDSGSWGRTKQVLTGSICVMSITSSVCGAAQRVCHQDALSQQVMLSCRQGSPLQKYLTPLQPDAPGPATAVDPNPIVQPDPAADDERLQYINAQILDAGERITKCEEIHRTSPNTKALLKAQGDKIRWTNKRNNADLMRSTPVTPLTTPAPSIRHGGRGVAPPRARLGS
jgi:hypothetical protein